MSRTKTVNASIGKAGNLFESFQGKSLPCYNGLNNSQIFEGYRNQIETAADDSLREGDWKQLDESLIEIIHNEPTLFNLFQSKGMVNAIPGGYGVLISEQERMNDIDGAEVSMDGISIAENDKVSFDMIGWTVPVIHKDYFFNQRFLQSSRLTNTPIDIVMARGAQRLVARKLDEFIFNGAPNLTLGGRKCHGINNHPESNSIMLGANNDWVSSSGVVNTTADILGNVEKMEKALFDQNLGVESGVTLFVPRKYWQLMHRRHNPATDYGRTDGDPKFIVDGRNLLQTIIDERPFINDIVLNPWEDSSLIMLIMNDTTMDIGVAQDFTNIQWASNPQQLRFKVFGAFSNRIRYTQAGQIGIVKGLFS